MWQYKKMLQYPVNIKNPDPALAKLIMSQLGGPDGELGASMRYLNQRYSAPCRQVQGILTDVGTEELGHMEMISAIIFQLTRNLTEKEIKQGGFDAYFVDHTTGIYPVAASGVPFSAEVFQSTGDAIADLSEDLAAEGATVKEQPVFSIPEKALFYAGLQRFRLIIQNCRLQPHKNNKSQKYDRTSCFRRKINKIV